MTDSARITKSERILSIPVILILLVYFVIFAIINFIGFERLCTPDMYEDTLVARLMWEQKTLFPTNYVFGNQFYVAATPVLAALFYGLTSSMNLAMALATTLMSVFILISLLWMLRPFVKNRLTALCSMLALFSCVFAPNLLSQDEGQLFFVLASFYACYIICSFLVFGDYFRARSDSSLRPFALALSLLLCFATGMQSLRQTCVTILPILAFELLAALRNFRDSGSLWPKERRMSLWRALAYTAANLSGYLFMSLLDKPQYTIYSGASLFDGASFLGKLWNSIYAFRTVNGYEWFGGEYPVFFALIFIFYLLVLAAASLLALRALKDRLSPLPGLWWLTVISLLAVFSASLVSSLNVRSIYLFMYYPLLVFSLVMVMDKLHGVYRGGFVLLLCAVALGNAFFSYRDSIEQSFDDTPTPAQQVSDYAVEHGYGLVYGCHSYSAPSIAVYSDGALTAASWEDDIIFKVTPYINIQDVYGWSDYARAIYVFMPWELELCRTEIAGNGAELTLLGRFGDYTVFTSSKQLLYPLTRDK